VPVADAAAALAQRRHPQQTEARPVVRWEAPVIAGGTVAQVAFEQPARTAVLVERFVFNLRPS
jgi:hypothetical protein